MTTLKQAQAISDRLAMHDKVMQVLIEANIGLSEKDASEAALKLCRLFKPELFKGR